MALCEHGVDHRDVSIGNVLLGTDPSKPAGFIADLDLSSISSEAIMAAYPNEHLEIISKLKDGEWRTVRFSQLVHVLSDWNIHREQLYLCQWIFWLLLNAKGMSRGVED